MEYVAIDLHLRRSQFRIGLQDGTVVKDGKCDTTRADFTRVLAGARRCGFCWKAARRVSGWRSISSRWAMR